VESYTVESQGTDRNRQALPVRGDASNSKYSRGPDLVRDLSDEHRCPGKEQPAQDDLESRPPLKRSFLAQGPKGVSAMAGHRREEASERPRKDGGLEPEDDDPDD
jgi:hypothetical protein